MRPLARNGLTNERHIYNCRLSRARRVVENAFGILANQWRLYHCCIYLNPNNVTMVVKATILLHNILILPNDKSTLMLWIIGLKYMMMPFKILQSKDIDLQQLPMMLEITLLTISTVIMVLLNGKITVHKIEVITLDKGTLMLLYLLVGCWPANQKCCSKNIFFLFKKVVGHMTFVNYLTN